MFLVQREERQQGETARGAVFVLGLRVRNTRTRDEADAAAAEAARQAKTMACNVTSHPDQLFYSSLSTVTTVYARRPGLVSSFPAIPSRQGHHPSAAGWHNVSRLMARH